MLCSIKLSLLLALSITAQAQLNFTDTLKAQNLNIFLGFIQSTQQLTEFFSNLQNATCFVASDEVFNIYQKDWGPFFFKDVSQLFAGVVYPCVRGIYPASSFNTSANFRHSYLNQSSITNVTGGSALELVKEGNQSILYTGHGSNCLNTSFHGTLPQVHVGARQKSIVTKSDIPFSGGLIHVVDDILIFPGNISNVAGCYGNKFILDLGAAQPEKVAAFQMLPDVTMTVVYTNAAYKLFHAANWTAAEYEDIAEYGYINGSVVYPDMLSPTGSKFTTAGGHQITLTNINGTQYVDDIVVEQYSLTSQGIAYLVDGVPLPPNLRNQESPLELSTH